MSVPQKSSIKLSDNSRITVLNACLEAIGLSKYVAPFAKSESNWDEITTISIGLPEDRGAFVIDNRIVASPQENGDMPKEFKKRVIIHDKGVGATVIVIVNNTFVINLMQHRDALQRSLEELVRGILAYNTDTFAAENKLSSEEVGKAITFLKVKSLKNVVESQQGILTAEVVGQSYKDTALQSGKDITVLIHVTLPEFHGSAQTLLEMLTTPRNPRHVKVRLLRDILDRKFTYHDMISKAALFDAWDRLQEIVKNSYL